MKRHTTAVLFAGALLVGAHTLSAAEAGGGPIRITGECPSQFGASGGFADASSPPVKLVDDVAQGKLVWQSEETGIGFGKATSKGMSGYARGTGLPPSGAASPILAGGAVIQVYYRPRGPSMAQTYLFGIKAEEAEKNWEGPQSEFKQFHFIDADDIVIAIDAATGKTLWKQVFESKGMNVGCGKRGEWNMTPCSADGPPSSLGGTTARQGMVFAAGTAGCLYGLDLASGEVLWESNVGEAYQAMTAAKKDCLAKRALPAYYQFGRASGHLVVVDGVLLAPDWKGGVLGVDPATGKTLWHAKEKDGLTSGYNSPVPVTIGGKTYAACVNGLGILRLLDQRTGKVPWSHKVGSWHLTQPIFGKDLLLAFDASTNQAAYGQSWRADLDKVAVAKGSIGTRMGVLAGYKLSLTGAERVWRLDDAKYATWLTLDAGPSRWMATRRDGVVFTTTSDNRILKVNESDGKVLNEVQGCRIIYLWGDKLFAPGDIQHGTHSGWQVWDPATMTKLSESKFPSDCRRTCGYELPLYEVFADGFVFTREWKEGWGGGIGCYDLRKQ